MAICGNEGYGFARRQVDLEVSQLGRLSIEVIDKNLSAIFRPPAALPLHSACEQSLKQLSFPAALAVA